MTDLADTALLPAGLNDALPFEAAFEADTTERLMASFAAHGYDRVKPPLMEFEETLFAGNGSAMAAHAFRLMDPVSRRMLALRPDMTLQVARIATTRLAARPRPLRLAYGGQVLRIKGSQLRPERQFGQAGAELIGAPAPAGDIEVILMAVEALADLGVTGLTIDLGLPTLVPALLAPLGPNDDTLGRVRAALDRKDAAAVAALSDRLGQETTDVLSAMLAAAGPADRTLAALNGLALPEAAARERDGLAEVMAGIRTGAPDLTLTLYPVENRGFEYHTGVTFTVFARGVKGELGRGGRYLAGVGAERAEPSTGLTLFLDTVLEALPAPEAARRILLPEGTSAATGRALREQGWITLAALDAAADLRSEAARLRCSHLLQDGEIIETNSDNGDEAK